MLLDNISLFLLIVEKGSLAAAAREAGLSPTTVSERLAALEAHYDVVLLNRTTRSISLTEEGRTLVEGARAVLGEVEDLDSRIRSGAQTLSGLIRISAPEDIGRNIISGAIADFQANHPSISIDLHLSDGYVDIVGLGIDLAVRFGAISDSSLRVKHVATRRRILCASPAYLENHSPPETPADLRDHVCLMMRFGQNIDNSWEFRKGDVKHVVTVTGTLIANDGALVREWALQGRGIALKSEFDCAADIRAGRLIQLLRDYEPPGSPLQILFPPSRAQPRRVRAFADHLIKVLRSVE
ncbi:LysR family transcriptional regulator [uncultured Roseibium sp.]|uniref:LysR family transcriptional regulator n=1 Tax=uncultured Roseibium sp. TaxID=1936171 RepID=UPI002606DFF7|nr:LysR family transcriptional regulator [uncultured Roseibium sp.]